jgi:hypothetical protein
VGELRELAEFWTDSGDALSLYAQVKTPSELSHREEVISAKDRIQQALQKGNNSVGRADVQRALETVAEMKGNGGRAKVIFACNREKLWREFDVPGEFAVRAEAGPAFALAPLVAQERTQKRYCIALADRNRARLLLLEGGEIAEHSQVLDEEQEKVRTTGTSKAQIYDRRKEEQVRRHYQFLGSHLLHFFEHKDYDCLMVGCRDEMWPEIEAELHPELKRILVGRFTLDPGMATAEEIRGKAQAIVDQRDQEEEQRLLERAVGGAASRGLGAVGLRDVIDALEKGEVRTLLLPQGELRSWNSASLCENCGHLEANAWAECVFCGGKMRRFADAEEAVLRHALGRSIEVRTMRWVKLPVPDEIAAWLRFRAEVNTPQALAS